MTFLGSVKGRVNALSAYSSHIFRAEQTNIQHEKSVFQPWAMVPFGNLSFVTYSFLLDQ